MAFALCFTALRRALYLVTLCALSATAEGVTPVKVDGMHHGDAILGLAHIPEHQTLAEPAALWSRALQETHHLQTKDFLRVDSVRNPFLIQRRSSLAWELERLLRTVGTSAPAAAAPQPSGAASTPSADEPWLDPGNLLELP